MGREQNNKEREKQSREGKAIKRGQSNQERTNQ